MDAEIKIMKSSSSMSSLPSQSKSNGNLNGNPKDYLKTPDKRSSWYGSRYCNSLNSKKPRRTFDNKKMWRRSWNSTEELWKSCILSSKAGLSEHNTEDIELREFLELYTKIYEWLNSIQFQRGHSTDAKSMNAKMAKELEGRRALRINVNEKAKNIMDKSPKWKCEILWRIKHLNSQWDSLEKILSTTEKAISNYSVPIVNGEKEECDLDWVRNWLIKMENEMTPLDFRAFWTSPHLENQILKHKALQREIEDKSSKVHTALRKYSSTNQGRSARLENRWHQLRLRVLEWIEHLSTVEQRQKQKAKRSEICVDNSSDEEQNEPLKKNPRLGGETERNTKFYFTNLDEVHLNFFAMGQNQESDESAFKQTGSPVHPVIEYTYDESNNPISNSGILKRKLSPDPPMSFLQQYNFYMQQVSNPQNISTYYFKHNSDTEQQKQIKNILENAPSDQDDKENLQVDQMPEEKGTNCQRILDFGQETVVQSEDTKPLPLLNEINSDLNEIIEEMRIYEKELERSEIEKLVQNAELLVGNRQNNCTITTNVKRHSRGVGSVVGLAGYNLNDLVLNKTKVFEFKSEKYKSTFEEEHDQTAVTSLRNNDEVDKCGLNEGLSDEIPLSSSRKNNIVVHNSSLSSALAANKNNKNKNTVINRMDIDQDHLNDNTNTRTQNQNGKTKNVKSSRVRQWVRAHNNSEGAILDQKNTSSCDASAESTSESDTESSSEIPTSTSDDPSTSTFLQQAHAALNNLSPLKTSSKASSTNSSAGIHTQVQQLRGSTGALVFRPKKRPNFSTKPRPKSFTDAFAFLPKTSRITNNSTSKSGSVGVNCFASDTALNLFGSQSSASSSGGAGSAEIDSNFIKTENSVRKRNLRRRPHRKDKRRSSEFDRESELTFVRSISYCGGLSKSTMDKERPEKRERIQSLHDDDHFSHPLKPNFIINQAINNPPAPAINTNNEDHIGNDQDWDSYQEKYLSEPYSEEPYDPDRTLKLLAFGEDYGQYIQENDSECSSNLSGFEPNPRKRRPLMLVKRNDMAESDSDRDEINYLLSQSASQYRFIDMVFRKQLNATFDESSPAEYGEMEATCEENISSLQMILNNLEKPDALPFDVDVKSIQGILERWQFLKERIIKGSKLQSIQEEMYCLKKDFDDVHSRLSSVDPFDAYDLISLENKIGQIQEMLVNLAERKHKLQTLNDASVETHLYFNEINNSPQNEDMKSQLQELYELYEENFQLGSFLLEKMRYLQESWEKFEWEKNEFEKSILLNTRSNKLKLSSTSSDSGHGTDQDSSISDSDIEFQEKQREKLDQLKQRASDIKSFLPPGSPVLDVIEQRVNEVQQGFEAITHNLNKGEALDLKIIYPKKSPVNKRGYGLKLPLRKGGIRLAEKLEKRTNGRRYRILRVTLSFHFCLMGLLAAAYFLLPQCCDFSNTLCFTLVPQLHHDSQPPI